LDVDENDDSATQVKFGGRTITYNAKRFQ